MGSPDISEDRNRRRVRDAVPGRVYCRLAAVYGFKPWEITRLTEPQVIAYAQNMNHVSEASSAPLVYRLLEGIADIVASLFGKKR